MKKCLRYSFRYSFVANNDQYAQRRGQLTKSFSKTGLVRRSPALRDVEISLVCSEVDPSRSLRSAVLRYPFVSQL